MLLSSPSGLGASRAHRVYVPFVWVSSSPNVVTPECGVSFHLPFLRGSAGRSKKVVEVWPTRKQSIHFWRCSHWYRGRGSSRLAPRLLTASTPNISPPKLAWYDLSPQARDDVPAERAATPTFTWMKSASRRCEPSRLPPRVADLPALTPNQTK